MPRTHARLFAQVASFQNLHRAYGLARRAGRVRGVTARFDYHLEDELVALQSELSDGSYRPGPYRSFEVLEPKRRLVSAAPFRDRVVHHALIGVLEPIFERRFIDDSYACRPRKGAHRAVDRAHAFATRHHYCLGADILRFFPSVDHAVLQFILRRAIRCRRTLALISVILQSGAHVLSAEAPQRLFPGDDLLSLTRPRGIPIGNLTSQFFGNVVLDPIDHFFKEELRVRCYVRYADDFRVFADSKRELWDLLASFEERLGKLRLSLHPRKTHVIPCRTGVPFLGFHLFPNGRRRLQGRAVRRYRRRMRPLARRAGHDGGARAALLASLEGWNAHAMHADTHRLRHHVLEEARACARKKARSS